MSINFLGLFATNKHYWCVICLCPVFCKLLHVIQPTDLHIYILDVVPPIHVISNHVATDKLTTANGGAFTSSSDRLSSQSR